MGFLGGPVDFLIHWPPGPVVATVQCQGLLPLNVIPFPIKNADTDINFDVEGALWY